MQLTQTEPRMNLKEFHNEFHQDVLVSSQATGQLFEDTFFNLFTDILVDIGELATADRTHFSAARGVRVDGYAGDPIDTGTLTLIVLDTNQRPEIETLTKTELEAIFKRALNFIAKALDPSFRHALEQSDPSYGLAATIGQRWPAKSSAEVSGAREIEQIRLVVVSDRVLSARVDGQKASSFQDIPVVHSVWDIERLFNLVSSGSEQEPLYVDLLGEMGPPVPALQAHVDAESFPTFLLAIPGEQLARIYDRWGTRLLEQNVRVFLQALGTVNKGIRATIEKAPQMFLSYNNGLAITAESVETAQTENGLVITGLANLQIVNGGQTTASLHSAFRKNIDLSAIYVQMKMTVIPSEIAKIVVPKISEYANSQNKVNAADFFSNHPYHVMMEGMSRRIFAPASDGQFRQTKWFYERARGQYRDAQMKEVGAKRKEFDLLFPKKQLFNKTDLAKFQMVWAMEPHIVSRGAQKNFAAFANMIDREWDKSPQDFGEMYFQESIAKAIVFKATEKIVQSAPWYAGGYRANIVAFTLAKISYEVANSGSSFPFLSIWNKQELSNKTVETIQLSANAVQKVLVNPPASHSNITEWAKQQSCWARVKEIPLTLSKEFLSECTTAGQRLQERKDAKDDTQILIGIAAQTFVVNKGSQFWMDVLLWAQESNSISPKEASIVGICSRIPSSIPSEKQCAVAIQVLERMENQGFFHEID
jgi:hypothetical protein